MGVVPDRKQLEIPPSGRDRPGRTRESPQIPRSPHGMPGIILLSRTRTPGGTRNPGYPGIYHSAVTSASDIDFQVFTNNKHYSIGFCFRRLDHGPGQRPSSFL
ncbi:hypothetical protein QCA50_007054 [Cerrena zonata]|uniref:Uncharacterized protein n=1 Tax=Cerrena zonata TaxID=2478898 RepID=A0AAW0GAI9_9APHY